MRFSLYKRGAVVAYAFDDHGAIGLRRPDGVGLLRTSHGVPRPVLEPADIPDVTMILVCVAEDLDREMCEARGVEVVS
jgi:hypothetical protein